jgi:1-deoxy-D-xylulose 5-phosphate reductoisomerase
MKKVSILGSTGSIGTQTLDIIRENDDLELVAMSCGKNIQLFEKQIREFKPKLVSVEDEALANELKEKISDIGCKILFGMEGLIEAAVFEAADIVVSALVGMIGIEPTIEAIKAKKDIALANKESLCCAGHIIMPLAKRMKVNIFPVDSEHSAVFQCLQGNEGNKVSRILLTASGGPFRGYTKEQLADVKLSDALKHPNWSMGKKITVDSSTMVNKGLELIEAYWLFGVKPENIEIIVQPQSIIHSMVEFEDGSVIAQLGTPDMHLPIQYALLYPERRFLKGERLDFTKLFSINIEKPDMEVFEGPKLAFEAIKRGGSMPTVFNAANEYAVSLFLDEKIRYLDIIEYIKYAMNNHKFIENPNLCDILSIKKDTELGLSEFEKEYRS